jgi:hypothetical protein
MCLEVVVACNPGVDTARRHEGPAIAYLVDVDADSHGLEEMQHFA